jgi:hypothetical protein
MMSDIVATTSKDLAIRDAVRLLGKEYRRGFTDAIKEFDNYICPSTGDASQSAGKSYIAYTRTLNKIFGLSKEQAEAHANGENIRDLVPGPVLHAILLAELDAAAEIYGGMRDKMPRQSIKMRMKEAFERHANTLRRIQMNQRGFA